ncbi:MAG TPA: Wzz/FepE/Etk N-terminal domain-containing protein [Nitrospiria bacterium]|nr:Wzz/FepE/Etk N-terminal domain-containing protein [Nitrospiria bacterium]
MDDQKKDLREYLDLFQRRKIQILAPTAVLFILGILVAFLLPSAYRSTATILIEEQEVPTDLVRSTVTSYADQRIETIKHQVMTRSNLWKIVEQYGLYSGLRRRSTTEDVLERFVDDIKIEVISAEVVDRRTGQPTHATIAFTLAYDGETPELAQKVANELTSLFLSENLKTRERNAQETTVFLKGQAQRLSGHIKELEKKISVFKERAQGALPELTQLNMQLLNQVDQELINVDQQVRSLEEKKISLEGQLATLKPNTPIITASGERILDREERLKALRAQYASSASYLSAQHPDVIKMKREIDALEKEVGKGSDADELSKQITDARANLSGLLERYGEDHPDVVRYRKIIASLEKEIAQAKTTPEEPAAVPPENPAYILTQSQLSSAIHDLDAMKATRAEMKARAQELSHRLEETPMIEQVYLDLTRDRDNSVEKYREIRSKLVEAQVSEVLEDQRKGERFSLIDPPALPEKPEKPKRPVIVFLSLVLAAAGGIGYGAAAESLDHSVHTAQTLGTVSQAPPLAVIPYMPNTEDRKRSLRIKRRLIGGSIGLLVISLMTIHLLWVPLDVLWFVVLRKLGVG